MYKAGCTQDEINDAYDYNDTRGQTAYDQKSPERLPPLVQEYYEGECNDKDLNDNEKQPSTFDERESSRLS
eukprot:1119733-Amphidinium_carterae.1